MGMPSTFARLWAQRLRDSHKPAYLLIPELLAEDLASEIGRAHV